MSRDGGGSVGRRAVQLLGLAALQAVLLLGSAGTVRWPAAWAYLGLYVLLLLVAGAVLRSRREVIAERSRGSAGALRWDVVVTRLMGVTSVSVLVAAGLAVRWAWQPSFDPFVRGVGVLLLVAGYGLVIWAMAANRFFSQVVRIQAERDHVAVTDGPYRVVRHPGYVGMLASMVGAVLLLGSPWAFLPAVAYAAVLVVRTALEDATLQRELPGYAQYAARTRFRLLPGVW